MEGLIEQTFTMRYTDTDILEQELDRILGSDNWKTAKIFGEQIIISANRQLTQDEINEIRNRIRIHYENKSGN
ncbi:hypothetical protein F4775DRAFT_575659 [Biscogniauxia sp. FL1348]|nr:hypothetical protein F4775DRAFT_575659 [Biscogniauxia sp. FL1348]